MNVVGVMSGKYPPIGTCSGMVPLLFWNRTSVSAPDDVGVMSPVLWRVLVPVVSAD